MADEAPSDQDEPWVRRPEESPKAYAAFRVYRDLAPHQREWANVAKLSHCSLSSVKRWSAMSDWAERTAAWDDATHRQEDRQRLDSIREMHKVHATAGRAAVMKASTALDQMTPDDLTPQVAARLLELGARLERQTLIYSVEELQGIDELPGDAEDPWERIAAELDPHPAADSRLST